MSTRVRDSQSSKGQIWRGIWEQIYEILSLVNLRRFDDKISGKKIFCLNLSLYFGRVKKMRKESRNRAIKNDLWLKKSRIRNLAMGFFGNRRFWLEFLLRIGARIRSKSRLAVDRTSSGQSSVVLKKIIVDFKKNKKNQTWLSPSPRSSLGVSLILRAESRSVVSSRVLEPGSRRSRLLLGRWRFLWRSFFSALLLLLFFLASLFLSARCFPSLTAATLGSRSLERNI